MNAHVTVGNLVALALGAAIGWFVCTVVRYFVEKAVIRGFWR